MISMQLRYLIFSFLNSKKRNLHAVCHWYLSFMLISRISMINWKQLIFCDIRNHLSACLMNWFSIFYFAEILTVSHFQISAFSQHDIIFIWLKKTLEIMKQFSHTIYSKNESSRSLNMSTFSHRKRFILSKILMSKWQS